MGLPTGAALDDGALRVWKRALDTRTVALSLLGLSAPFLSTLGDDRALTALTLLLGVVPYNVVLARRLRSRRRLDAFMPVTDLLIAVGFAAMVPESLSAVIGIAVADIAFAVMMFGKRLAIVTTIVGAIALLLAGRPLHHGVDVGMAGFLFSAVVVITTVGSVNSREKYLRQRFTALVHGVDGVVWEYDIATQRLTFVSRQVEHILGWNVDDALAPEMWSRNIHPEDRRRIWSGSPDLSPGMTRTTDFRMRHADGRWIWMRDSLTFELDDDTGAVKTVRGIASDVTEQKQAELTLQKYADIVEQIQLSLTVWQLEDEDDDSSLRAVQANPAALEVFGGRSEGIVGKCLLDVWPDVAGRRFTKAVADTVRTGQRATFEEVSIPRPDGTERFFSVRAFPLPDRCAGLVTEDITGRHEAAMELRHQALHDSLTGLPNRALLLDRLATALSTARRTEQPVALLVMDLDQFKEINDTLGHPMGDRMLEQVGARLSTVLRDCDTVARLGGDEFAVLLTVAADFAGAERVAVRIGEALAEPFDLGGMAVQTAASLGIALSPEHGVDAGTLVQRADVAMYNAKRGGRGFAFYDAEDDRSSLRRLALVGELRGALEREELVLHYQPQIGVADGEVVGVEALVRWQHPVHGLLPPSEFIELAEVSGAIQPLTRWVVRTAAAEAAELAAAGHPLVMSVNVSARNLYDPDLVRGIAADLEACGVPPESLMLELTESQLVDDPSQVMTVLSLVSGMGVRLSIDDFGTGWSSLANLTRLPMHQIKIDKSFVSRMLQGGDDAVIVRSIVDLGHNLGLVVVAEGVEDGLTLAALDELGCDQAQGYLISRPVPAPALLAWLTARKAVPELRSS